MGLWTRNIFIGRLCVLNGVGGGWPCRQGDAWRQALSREGYGRKGAGGAATHEGNNKVAEGREGRLLCELRGEGDEGRGRERQRQAAEGRRGRLVDKCPEASDCVLVRRLSGGSGKGSERYAEGKGEFQVGRDFAGNHLRGKSKGRGNLEEKTVMISMENVKIQYNVIAKQFDK